MECLEPGAIRDEELLAYLAGEKVRPFVEQHLTTCQYCANRLAEFRRIELTLTSKLYRWDCPPTQVLGEYQLGMLSQELTAAVENHLSMCVLCAAEVTALNEFLADDSLAVEPAPPVPVAVLPASSNNHHPVHGAKRALEDLLDRSAAGVRRIAATLIPPSPRLAYRGDVGSPALWPLRFKAEDVNISVQVERGTGRSDALQLIGFVTRSGESLETLEGVPVQLASGTSMQYTQNIDELGNFVFSSVAPATYSLEVQFPESTVVIEQLPVTLQD